MGKIAIVSDSMAISNSLQSKLVLLREDDIVVRSETADANKITVGADVILFHSPEITDITLATVKQLKKRNSAIILVLEEINPQILPEAYDAGVCDFCTVNVTNAELLIRIVNAKKALKTRTTTQRYKTLLRNNGILKYNSDTFTNLEHILITDFDSELSSATMLAIEIDMDAQENFILYNKEELIRSHLRENDFLINYDDFKYLIILPKTTPENGTHVFEKLYTKTDKKINGVLFKYNNETPKEIYSKIARLKIEQEENGLTLYLEKDLLNEETESDWLNDELTEEPPKTYKLFQNIYTIKTENVIEPAFYRTKQKFEKHFPNSKIKYFTDKTGAEFMLVNFDRTNSFKLNLKNSAKVGIEIKYTGLEAPENETFELPFSQLTTVHLSEMLENFITKGEINETIG